MASSSPLAALLRSTASRYCGGFPVYPVRLSCGNPMSFPGRLSVRAMSSIVLVEKNESEIVDRLKRRYVEQIVPVLINVFNYKNIHQVPKVVKIDVNCGIGEAAQNAKGLDAAMIDLAIITGQKPMKIRENKAITTYKMREVQALGITVTLRGNVMYSFLDRLLNLELPGISDFQDVDANSFDGHGNYRFVLPYQSVFSGLTSDVLGMAREMNVSIKTTANSDSEAHKLLALMGMPFKEGVVVPKKKLKSHHFDSESEQRARK